MLDSVPDDKRAEWRAWVKEQIAGDEAAIERATNAALTSLLIGQSTDDAMTAARSAASSSEGEARPHPVSDADHLRGIVSVFRERNELMGNQYGSVWNFRVDRWDSSGTPQASVTTGLK